MTRKVTFTIVESERSKEPAALTVVIFISHCKKVFTMRNKIK